MNKKGEGEIAVIILTIIIGLIIILSVVGLQIKTTVDGSHTGYVTAVETNGVIFKTNSIYFKTDTESTQEDRYCVKDKELLLELKEYSKNGTKITIGFYDVMFYGVKNCKGGDIAIVNTINEDS